MADKKEGTKFLHYFGPLLDALRALGGSATPEEATDKLVAMFEKLELGLKPKTVFDVDEIFFEEFRRQGAERSD